MTTFPTRYKNAPEPVGEGWLAHYQDAARIVASGGIVVLYGGNGTGKTRMAYEIAKEVKAPNSSHKVNMTTKYHLPAYTTAVNLFMEIRDTYNRDSDTSERRVVERYTDASILVIDEIQERGETPFEDRKLTQIIDLRYQHEKPTILISNYSREQFAKALSPSVLDRIRENGKGLHFDWTSFRR
jgi:DNA replication protein DnaC